MADQIVREMDADFELETTRFPPKTGLGPEFSRLPPHARMALAQELYRLMLTERKIQREGKRLLDAGMREFPPRPSGAAREPWGLPQA